MNWEHSLGREKVEKAGVVLSKFETVVALTILLEVVENNAGSPLTSVTRFVKPLCV